ncbi:response regulator transcription factor [Sutcliffiella halmapala]|uniref:response regulator transcription factor n=1 Tax=Sutcliffiella halmapala TaxID=79882 RepID=UPI0009952F2A|nr:response regulator transcription factor [Sutcliffiella halmapala]
MTNILVVDDDKHTRKLICNFLGENGYVTAEAENGIVALQLLSRNIYNVAIVDIMMPKMNGYELTKEIREVYDLPVIMLTAKSQLQDKERGFAVGTDDYLIKPFELKELQFRIKALLRRTNQESEQIIKISSIVINKASYEVQVGDQTLLLPLKEFELLFVLASNQNRVLTREQLIQKIWGLDFEGNERTVDVHIKRLRERMRQLTEDVSFKTIRGVGYSLEVLSS